MSNDQDQQNVVRFPLVQLEMQTEDDDGAVEYKESAGSADEILAELYGNLDRVVVIGIEAGTTNLITRTNMNYMEVAYVMERSGGKLLEEKERMESLLEDEDWPG